MTKLENIKEFIFIILTIFLMVVVVGVFVYMVKTERGSTKMMNFLSSIRSGAEQDEEVKESLDTKVLENEKFRELKENPVPEKEFDSGNKNPFRGGGDD